MLNGFDGSLSDKYVPWKLIFKIDVVEPGQISTCEVCSSYIFRGNLLLFDRSEGFVLQELLFGRRNQIRCEVPCESVHGNDLLLDVVVRGTSCVLKVRNTSDAALPFRAELQGMLLAGADEVPVEQDFEGFIHCRHVRATHVVPGWGCCRCRCYNGYQRQVCRNCGHPRCYDTSGELGREAAELEKIGSDVDLVRAWMARRGS
jgi:hypothetical protein